MISAHQYYYKQIDLCIIPRLIQYYYNSHIIIKTDNVLQICVRTFLLGDIEDEAG